MSVDRILGLRVASPVALGGEACASGEASDVELVLEPAAPQQDVATSDATEVRGLDDAPYLRMGRLEGGLLLRFPDWADFIVGHDGRRITCTPVPGIALQTVRHLLLSQVLPRAIGLLREPALHGSAASREDRAIGFLGPTGHGKSTLALSLACSGWTLLADDCLLLHTGDVGVEVVPSGVGARVWPDTANRLLAGKPPLSAVAHYTDKRSVDDRVGGLRLGDRAVPLQRLYLLDGQEDPAAAPTVSIVAGREAFESLLQHVTRLSPVGPERLRREFEFLTGLVNKVVFRRLRFPWAFEQLPAVRAAIEADLARTP